MKKHIPNFLTLFRIALVPVFVWMIFFSPFYLKYIWSALIFIIASITDYYDGMLARKLKVISNFGKLMDPVADKILVISALVALALPDVDLITIPIIIIIVAREVIITLLRYYLASRKIIIPAKGLGKLKTVLQLTGIITALVYKSFLTFFPNVLNDFHKFYIESGFKTYFWIVALVTVISGLSIIISIRKINHGVHGEHRERIDKTNIIDVESIVISNNEKQSSLKADDYNT